MKKLLFASTIVGMMACAISAMAFVDTGTGIEIGSWAQQFNESGVGAFDTMKFLMLGGYEFEGPGLSGLAAGWTSSLPTGTNSQFVQANGPASTNMNFYVHFAPAKSQPISFYFQALNGTSILETAQADWNGSSWNIYGVANRNLGSPAVPEPMTVLLGIMGLTSVAGFRRLRKS